VKDKEVRSQIAAAIELDFAPTSGIRAATDYPSQRHVI
jgi:hypothetical protein